MTDTPRIYVASLTDYNNAVLHGQWIDADQDVDDIWAEVQDMLAKSPTVKKDSWAGPAEEWAIHDYEGFGPVRLSEWEAFETVSVIAKGIVEHGDAFAAYASLSDGDRPGLDRFEECNRGTWDSEAEWAEEFINDVYHEAMQALEDGVLSSYVTIDYEAFARDSGYMFVQDARTYKVHVFDMEV